YWIDTHLTQFVGATLMTAALVLLSRVFAGGPAQAIGWLGMAGAIATLAVAAGLQAVDGIALKAMVDAWSLGTRTEAGELFHAAWAVRQIEIGLASIGSLLFGVTVFLF